MFSSLTVSGSRYNLLLTRICGLDCVVYHKSQNPYSCVMLSSESQGKRWKYQPLTGYMPGSVVWVKTSPAPVHLHVLCLFTECHSVKKSVIFCTVQAGVVSPQVYHAQSSIVSRSVGTTSWTTLYHVDRPVSDKCIHPVSDKCI